YPPPNGTMTINSATGEFEFIPAMSDAESFFDVYVGLSDGIGEEEVCQFNILVTLETEEVCGDADTNGMVNIADVVYLINYIFGDGPPPQPLEFGDADCSGLVNIADVVYLIAHIFGGGSAPGDPDNDGIPECVCEKVESCWVIAFGPCCLCKGATQTYFAVGWPPGGSYSWAITAGANKASIVGPNNKSTVQVKGDNVSAATGDVTLTVTYTVGECVATDQVVITVITVALSFDCGGNTSDDNDVPPDASCGLPQLGINSPGNPAGCTGFHKNIEIEGHIEPCDANLASCLTDGWCDIDIKRTRQGRVGFKPGAGAFIPHALDCPSPAWCNDDHHNTDEDLTPSAPPNCNIYVIDTPGMGDVNGACNTTTHVINWLNFKEWVEVNGIKCGEEQEWHATTRIKCVGNKWVMDYGPPGQGVGVGHITIPTPGSRESDSWEGPFSVSLVIDMLSSNSLANRVIGQAMIIDRYDDGKLTENERAELVFELRGLAEVPEHLKARDSTPALAEELLKLLEESLDR
ncbi:MAG: dockerin type I repeat-containing protein, partial [candidate division Zixibacteria bacterium]|nr:dockerin type I repeat-containing protein [candidate division Zixibacteria bacterium]